jgi:GldL N-terminal domain
MKQKIYILGVITALVVFIGAIFKVNHWPGAGVMLTLGLLTMVFIFLPAALVNHYKSEESNHNILLYIVTYLTCFVIFISMLFKIQHWPFAGTMLTVALPFPYVVFLPVFLIVTAKNKNFNIYNTVFVLLLLALNSVFSALLALNVTSDRIKDSYNLSRNYNRMEIILSQLPDSCLQSPLNSKIDDVIKILDETQTAILHLEQISLDQWINNPGRLIHPDQRKSAELIMPESYSGEKLASGLKSLLDEMKTTPGYVDLARYAPVIFGFEDPALSERDWAQRIFNDNTLSWTLIYLDGLRANLLLIKTAGPSNLIAT